MVHNIPTHVFLDTQFFVRNQFDIHNGVFQALRSNVAAGHIRLFSTEVTRLEVEHHLKTRIDAVCEKLDSIRRHPLIRNLSQAPFDTFRERPTKEEIAAAMQDQFRRWWDDVQITTLPLREGGVQNILEDYFASRPPFGQGKKKNEFPDAFAVDSILDWCGRYRKRMCVVSGDGDWATVCEAKPDCLFAEDAAALLSRFPNARVSKAIREWLESQPEEVAEQIRQITAADLHSRFFFDRLPEAVSVNVFWLRDYYVIQLVDGVATVRVTGKYSFKVRIDPSTPARTAPGLPAKPLTKPIVRSKGRSTFELAVRYDEEDLAEMLLVSVKLIDRLNPFE